MSGPRVALVIGGGTGIGQATALHLAREGCQLVVAGRRGGPLQDTVAAIERGGGLAQAMVSDVAEPGAAAALVAAVLAQHGRLNVAINAFGVAPRFAAPLDRLRDEDLRAIVAINYRGLFLALQAEAGAMKAGGAIVNLASVLGQVGWAGHSAYSASKHAAIGLSQVAAAELIERGVRLNTVCPGLVRSPMLARLAPRSLKAPPLDLRHAPDEAAAAATIAWLASDASEAVYGQTMVVGGHVRRL